jgi:TatD DNase family protein
MPLELIDTHCHIDFSIFDHDRDEILKRCQKAGIRKIVVPAVEFESWPKLVSLNSPFVHLYKAYGLHPVFLDNHQDIHLEALDRLLETNRPAAIGEIGLDFFLKDLDKRRQHKLFVAQLKLAMKHQLPVILHVRKAHDQVLECLESHRIKGGFVHAFNGTLNHAQRYCGLGFKLGIGGAVTWPKARKVRALAEELPASSIVLETDAPDMAVESIRSRSRNQTKPPRNSPEYLLEILDTLATIRDTTPKELAISCTQNALSVLETNV